ncbi:hypothetical protein [Novipirellula caenicola]|uniref:Uncharacterized protein n=1 Tax=Novipirellula caenicola TaxID=1536901 RepID=A0ABP9VZR7_9BACT
MNRSAFLVTVLCFWVAFCNEAKANNLNAVDMQIDFARQPLYLSDVAIVKFTIRVSEEVIIRPIHWQRDLRMSVGSSYEVNSIGPPAEIIWNDLEAESDFGESERNLKLVPGTCYSYVVLVRITSYQSIFVAGLPVRHRTVWNGMGMQPRENPLSGFLIADFTLCIHDVENTPLNRKQDGRPSKNQIIGRQVRVPISDDFLSDGEIRGLPTATNDLLRLTTDVHGGLISVNGTPDAFTGILRGPVFPVRDIERGQLVRKFLRDECTVARLIDLTVGYERQLQSTSHYEKVAHNLFVLLHPFGNIEKQWLIQRMCEDLNRRNRKHVSTELDWLARANKIDRCETLYLNRSQN